MANPIIKENRVTVRCSRGCKNSFRISHFDLMVQVGLPFRFCPTCGAEGLVTSQSIDISYWEVLAEEYGYGVDVMKQIYSLWDPREHRNFSTFIVEFEEEVRTEALKTHAQLEQAS